MTNSRNDFVWSIELGKRLGPFHIGSSINEAIFILKRRDPTRSFEILYNNADLYKEHILIVSPEDGIKLVYNSTTQLLMKIDVYQLGCMYLRYGRAIMFGPDILSTFSTVYNLFGPTFPGQFESSESTYTLGYEGGCIRFSIPNEFKHIFTDDFILPLSFPDGSFPIANGISIFCKQEEHVPKPSSSPSHEDVMVNCSQGNVAFFFNGNVEIGLGWSPQEVISVIGSPTQTFHIAYESSPNGVLPIQQCGNYFHNYPLIGLDVMYNNNHKAIKIILKTNAPSHPEFGVYHKCTFVIRMDTSLLPDADSTKSYESISSEAHWDLIKELLRCDPALRPVIHDSGLGMHPFGSGYCYSPIPGCTLEIMKNGYIATATFSLLKT